MGTGKAHKFAFLSIQPVSSTVFFKKRSLCAIPSRKCRFSMNLNSSSFFSFHLLDKAKRNATTKWKRYESWSNQKKWSLLHGVFSIGTLHSGFHGGVNGRPVVRALTGTPKIACIDMKIRRIVRLPFSLICCPLLPCKREVAAKRTNQGGAASPNSRNSVQITGCRRNCSKV